jgi:hypothetical protein
MPPSSPACQTLISIMVPELYLVEYFVPHPRTRLWNLDFLTFDFRPPHISCLLISRTLFRILPFCGSYCTSVLVCLSQYLNLPPLSEFPHITHVSFSASQLARRHLLFFSHDSGYKETLLSAKRLGLLFSPIVCFVPCILPITIFLLERIQAPWGQNSLSTEFERRPALRGVRCRWERRRCAVAPNSWRRHKAELALVAGGITRSFPRTPVSDPVFISVRLYLCASSPSPYSVSIVSQL